MEILTSKLLSPYKNLLHAYTTRSHGHSIYGNNLAYHVNDAKEDVEQNHIELATYLHYPLDKLVHMNQIHGDDIIFINQQHNYDLIPTCDALITQEKNTPLMVMVADCIPILIYDPVKEVIAAVHAGRAGIFTKVLPKTIKKMRIQYGCKAKDLLISLGPSIRQCCYEVGSEIETEAQEKQLDYAMSMRENKYFLDLLTIAHNQLKEAGIKTENIETSPYCTACNTEQFFSYRVEKNRCGRFCGLIMLK